MRRSRAILLGVCLLLASCARECNRFSRFMRRVELVFEIAAWICGSLFVLVFVVGGIATIVKNHRGATDRSRRWGKIIGGINLVLGLLFVISMAMSPPQERIEETQYAVEEVVDAQGNLSEQRVPVGTTHSSGGTNLSQLLILLGLGAGWSAFGGAGLRAARRR